MATSGRTDERRVPAASPPEPGWAATRRLDRVELRRRVWHMLPGLLPFLLWYFPHRDPISPTLRGIMIALAVGLGGMILVRFHRIARPGERDRLAAVAGYAGSVLAMLLLFPGEAELGLTVLAVLAFGDGSATLFGKLLGGPTLPWNRAKTWAGFLAFLAAGVPMASLVYWGETHFNPEALPPGGVPFTAALVCGASAVLAAAVVESLSSRINDNLRVGITAAVTLAVVHGSVVGW